MAFKNQDLLISDLSTKGVVVLCTKTTAGCGSHSGLTGLTVITTTVTTLTLLACIPFLGRKPEDSAEQVALLKTQLKEALAEMEREDASIAEQFKPKTVEEAETMERELMKALDHVRDQKLKLSNE